MTPEEQGVLAFFEKMDQTKTYPDGTLESMVAYVDEFAQAVLADETVAPGTHAIATKCRDLVVKVRAGDEQAKFQLGVQYRLLQSAYVREVVAAVGAKKRHEKNAPLIAERNAQIITDATAMVKKMFKNEQGPYRLNPEQRQKILDDLVEDYGGEGELSLGRKSIQRLLSTALKNLNADLGL